jgi:CrcB protein
VGGGLGAVARFLGVLAVGEHRALPLGTIAVNVLGSALLGFVLPLVRENSPLRLALATGLLGGFTTYSSFNYETFALLQNGSPGLALLNVAATLLGCMLGVALGWALGQGLAGS